MFIKKIAFFAILISLLWISGSLAEIKEGLLKITTKTETKGLPVQMPAITAKQCITENNPVPQPTMFVKHGMRKLKEILLFTQ